MRMSLGNSDFLCELGKIILPSSASFSSFVSWGCRGEPHKKVGVLQRSRVLAGREWNEGISE